MIKEQSTFIVDLIDIAKRAECKITITTKSGHVVCEVGPETFPFKVDEDGVVYMDNAKVDYEALNMDVGELMRFLDSRIGTLRQEILRMSAKTSGEHASHVSMKFYVGELRLTVEPTEVPLFDPRKDIGETFSKACKSWTESIAEATSPRSDLAKTIEHLTVRLDPEELYDDLVKSPEFKSVIVDALCRGPRTVHIKL
ncbi:hypothetical protein [Brucella haematophila]|uniref:Uncharacterized protein n=1 Tax=Brucella haematophila TaxID=419474 RepID=A0ABX1DMC5_9HYPH|nr:hypothetical protein [Brucella haematophila]NKC04093.1 hypothetical protein [Brucella haematophila]TMV05875.1 hypothetical protein FGI60_00675 [Brucella haematophila]